MSAAFREILKSKIHRARVTAADLDYEGSISIDNALLETADIAPYEKVDVYNITNGARFTTYALPVTPGSGEIRVNGAAAHLAQPGHLIIIASYISVPETSLRHFKPKIVRVNEKNQAEPVTIGR